MTTIATVFRRAVLVAAAALPAACAQPGQPAPQMQSMDMPTMMKHCADMKQSMGHGQMSQEMQKMMADCDDMDRSMGISQPAPDTHSR